MTTTTAPRERPILFSGPMVRAILAGTKTQTRRVLKGAGAGAETWVRDVDQLEWSAIGDLGMQNGARGVLGRMACPYGAPGDRLWVRETVAIERWTREYGDQPPLPTDRPWKHVPDTSGECGETWYWPHYRATDPAPDLSCERDGCRVCESGEPGPHWSPSIHMPRWACRIVLEITDVRVQRLQNISEDNARAEGVDGGCLSCGENKCGCARPRPDHRDSFAGLWNTINGAGAWDESPWVWALTFKRVT